VTLGQRVEDDQHDSSRYGKRYAALHHGNQFLSSGSTIGQQTATTATAPRVEEIVLHGIAFLDSTVNKHNAIYFLL